MAEFCRLKGCVAEYPGSPLKQVIDTTVLMPWVEVWFKENGEKKIAVSNISSKNNLATIKSFQFGMSNGAGCQIEIIDEESGNFARFFQKLTTGNAESLCKYTLQFRWGWAKSDCLGDGRTFGKEVNWPGSNDNTEITMSKTHTMVVKNVNCDVSKGMFKFIVEGTDLTLDLYSSRSDHSIGTDRDKVPLVTAIKELLGKFGIKAKFKRMEGSKMVDNDNITWKRDSPCVDAHLGMNGRWNALNRNPIQVCRDWLNTTITDKNKGIIAFWDTTEVDPTIVYMEVSQPTCEREFDSLALGLNLGKYIVNGGRCSPVISFSPQLNWDISQIMYLVGGVAGDAQAAYAFKNAEGPEPCWTAEDKQNVNHAGIQNSQFPMDTMNDCYGKLANVIGNRKKMVHQHANLNARPISAEMRVQGDPSYAMPIFCRGYFVSIVFINPFYLSSEADEDDDQKSRICKWLAQPPCNDILSNTNWMIDGVFHEIREGSYTTTLKLKLPAPGIDIPRPAGLGGNGKKIPTCNAAAITAGLVGAAAAGPLGALVNAGRF